MLYSANFNYIKLGTYVEIFIYVGFFLVNEEGLTGSGRKFLPPTFRSLKLGEKSSLTPRVNC